MTRFLAMASLLLATGCGESQSSPTTPSPSTPSPGPTFSLSGVVYESTAEGRRPLADVGIDVSPEFQANAPKVTSDAEGRFHVSGLLARNVKVIATKTGYSQPCRTPIALTVDSVLDVYVVSDSILSTTGVPSSFPVLQLTLSGLVFERTPQGARPIAGASLIADFSGGNGWAPSARTLTDAAGRYLLCGMAEDLYLDVLTNKTGYRGVTHTVDIDETRSVDIELFRQ